MASKEYISELTEVHILEFLLPLEGQTAKLNMKINLQNTQKTYSNCSIDATQ